MCFNTGSVTSLFLFATHRSHTDRNSNTFRSFGVGIDTHAWEGNVKKEKKWKGERKEEERSRRNKREEVNRQTRKKKIEKKKWLTKSLVTCVTPHCQIPIIFQHFVTKKGTKYFARHLTSFLAILFIFSFSFFFFLHKLFWQFFTISKQHCVSHRMFHSQYIANT